jgi:hypothetical protein
MSAVVFPNLVETANDLPEFCAQCGRRLKIVHRLVRYDGRDGKPVYQAQARCPQPWWTLLLGEHDRFIVSPRPRSGGKP